MAPPDPRARRPWSRQRVVKPLVTGPLPPASPPAASGPDLSFQIGTLRLSNPVGTASGSQNPETAYAREQGFRIYSFAEAIGAFFAKERSIVCVGTWGKTSSSAMLSFVLDHTGYDPSYMFGGVSLSHESSARLTESAWSGSAPRQRRRRMQPVNGRRPPKLPCFQSKNSVDRNVSLLTTTQSRPEMVGAFL